MTDTLLATLRFLFAGALLVAGFFLLSFLLSSAEIGRAQAKEKTTNNFAGASNSPNVVTSGMAKAADGLTKTMGSTVSAISSSVQSAASVTAQTGKSVARGAQTGTVAAARGVGSALVFTGRTQTQSMGLVGRAVGGGVLFVAGIPGDALGFVTNTSVVSTIIQPSDHEEVPIIDPNSPELRTALAALPPTKDTRQATSQRGLGPQWPMHGRVTTEFGVDHWPYQHTHTGIDISNGHGAKIKPFRPGRVIETIYSNRGLGNHVVVDHGNGVTSVYAHLSSISVREGQKVGLKTTLGVEGTTGVSTGNHLHFEIRVNGKAADPRKFISGQP